MKSSLSVDLGALLTGTPVGAVIGKSDLIRKALGLLPKDKVSHSHEKKTDDLRKQWVKDGYLKPTGALPGTSRSWSATRCSCCPAVTRTRTARARLDALPRGVPGLPWLPQVSYPSKAYILPPACPYSSLLGVRGGQGRVPGVGQRRREHR